ncbi:hypothetical protein SBA6_1110005 [Candidatus Sulfopaludibacter sp. SbA6]|nr:hypothetical protein SBA6_1110005 [Candidatus Sulfopaludibacter sp. SbA6]
MRSRWRRHRNVYKAGKKGFESIRAQEYRIPARAFIDANARAFLRGRVTRESFDFVPLSAVVAGVRAT